MIKGFRGTFGDLKPVPFECEEFGYPHKTTTGDDMFANTHFLTEWEAWESIRRSVDSWVRFAGHEVSRIKELLRKAEQEAAQAAQDYEAAMRGWEEASTARIFSVKI